MRVLQLAPLWKSVPPKKYGGTELVVSLLTEELVKNNFKVDLVAAGGSVSRAKLIEATPKPLFEQMGKFDFGSVPFADILAISYALDMADRGQIDLIHNHMGYHGALLGRYSKVPVITTLHSSVEPDERRLALAAKYEKFVSISNAQRRLAPYLNYIGTVYHGIETGKFNYKKDAGKYLAYFATMREEKGADRAIEIAQSVGIPLIMAGDIRDRSDYDKLKPKIDGVKIRYIGELNFKEKNRLLSGALAYLFPIRWNEAFGLTVAESLACGTPVIAWPNGSMPELIENERTGYLVNSVGEAVEAVRGIAKISRSDCRQAAVARFDVKAMTAGYIKLYDKVTE